jgi:DNA-binding NarL/FixJ family response regulator
VILVSDHPVTMAGLEVICATAKDIHVLAQTDCAKAFETLQEYKPDVVVIDAYLPAFCSEDIASEVKQREPSIPVLVLAPIVDEEHLRSMLAVGVTGYLLTSEPVETILEAIRAVAQGQVRISAELAGWLAKPEHGQRVAQAKLTPREKEILLLVTQGRNNQEIAAALNLAEGTVKNHIVNIYSKLGVRTRVEALIWAQKHFR